ncbi:MAG: glycine zipper family protein [Candidatus Methylomirabilales bacterium]
MRFMKVRKLAVTASLAVAIGLVGCGQTTGSRALSGGAIGAGGGALIGAMAGNAGMGAAIGAGVGVIGGLVVDQNKKAEERGYQRGRQDAQ